MFSHTTEQLIGIHMLGIESKAVSFTFRYFSFYAVQMQALTTWTTEWSVGREKGGWGDEGGRGR